MKKLKLLDTFSGIGGFSYAAEKLVGGFETTQFIEIDPYCQKVLKKHWPHIPIHDDIKTFTAKPFQYDAICGGFPCQDISTAGRGKGITQETRSGLFYELIRIVRMVRPKYIILENVAAILNNGLDIVLGELSEAGYDAEWSIISASSLGACHQRSRWFCVAINREFAYPNNNGSFATEKSRSIEKTDGRTEKRKNQACQSQGGSESRNTETVQLNVTNPNSNGYEGRCTETRNKITSGQDSQIIGSTNTSELKRCSDDGNDKRESRIDGNLSGSSDGGKAISTETGRICDLSKTTDNNKRISNQNNYQENNDRTLVSEGQSRVQLPEHKELGRDKTTSEDNTIRYGDDNSSEQGMDNQESDVTNPKSKRTWKDESRLWGQSQGGDMQTDRDSNKKISDASNSISQRTQIQYEQRGSSIWNLPSSYGKEGSTLSPNWQTYESEPCLRRGDDGLSNWTHRLKALGNSVVPQVAAIPLQRVLDLENERQA